MGTNGDKKSKPKKKTRGPSTGKSFEEMINNGNAGDQEKEKKEKLHIEFNKLGQPYGPLLKDFRSDMGKMARNIRITRSWEDVTDGEKETMWLCAKLSWDVEDDKKKYILRAVRNRFKDWKTRMTGTYIFPKKKSDDGEGDDGEGDDEEGGDEEGVDGEGTIGSPVGKYKQLTQEDWDEFVKQRTSPSFLEKRKKAQAAQKHNVHPHYLGRAGYVGKQEKWYEEELKQEKENKPNEDPASTQKLVVTRLSDRGYRWIKAHTPPSSALPPPQLNKVVNDFGNWKEKEKKGEFVPSRFEDALVKALGKPEHTGRTRGVGGFVGLQTYFGKPPSRDNCGKRYTDDDIKLLIEKAKSEAMEQMNVLLEKKIVEALRNGGNMSLSDATLNDLPKNPSQQHHQSSCHSTHFNDPFIEFKERVPCRLAVIEDEEVIPVADGMVSPWVEGRIVHNTPLAMENAHVSIDTVTKPDALLPCPWSGFTKFGEVEGSFAQWPKTLILLGEDEASNEEKNRKRKVNNSKDTKGSSNKVLKKATSLEVDKGKLKVGGEENDRSPLSLEEVNDLSYHCKILEKKLCSYSTTACVKIVIDASVFNYKENKDIECHLTVVEIRQMFRYLWLNVVMLQAWGSFLYQGAITIEATKLVGYLCPVKLVEYMHNPRECEGYIGHAMKIHEEKKYIMGAFYEDNHWMLFVACVGLNTMYILDSQRRTPKTFNIKTVLQGAWVVYCAYGGRRNYNINSKLQIKVIDCPQQPKDYECGYYVMKWMYNITFKYSKSEEKDFAKNIAKSTMTISDMDLVRDVWASRCLEHI